MEVIVVGAGTVGSVTAQLLADAGVGVRVVDRDYVGEGNLERQPFYSKDDVGKAKALVVAKRLGFEGVCEDVTSDNTTRAIGKPKVVLDCTDNLATRFLLNDYCLKLKIPWIYSGAVETRGIVFAIGPEGKPCLRCLIPNEPGQLEACDLDGIDLEAARIVASLQVQEALKILNGMQPDGTMTDVDLNRGVNTSTKVPARENCEACNGTYGYLDSKSTVTFLCGRGAYMVRLGNELDLTKIETKSVRSESFDGVLHLYPDGKRITLFASGRAIVEASSESEARSRLARMGL